MAKTTVMTTDERFQKVDDGQWWDTTGIDIVPEEVVDAYMANNPGVGIMVMESRDEEDGEPAVGATLMTTDQRYWELSDEQWLDVTSHKVVPYHIVRAHMIDNPGVGVTKRKSDGEQDSA